MAIERRITEDDVARRIARLVAAKTAEPPRLVTIAGAGTGTGAGTDRAPAGFRNPMSAPGDLIRGGMSGAAARLAIGAAGEVLTVVGGLPSWEPSGAAYTDEQAQDAVGAILTDSSSIDLTYNDAANTITAAAVFGTTVGTVAAGNHTHAGATGRYRSPVYSTYGGGDLVWDSDGHLVYTLEALE